MKGIRTTIESIVDMACPSHVGALPALASVNFRLWCSLQIAGTTGTRMSMAIPSALEKLILAKYGKIGESPDCERPVRLLILRK